MSSETNTIEIPLALGKARLETVTLDPIDPQLYTFLPYRVTGVRISAPPAGKPGKTVPVKLTIEASAPAARLARHVLRVDVLGPEGKERTFYSRNLETEAGIAKMDIPLALNDPPGKWTLRVSDIATGTTAEGTLEVE